jgi:site-specific DNA recombinase
MLEYCRRHSNELDFAVFYSVSRLSRNTLDYLAIKAGLAGLGINLRSATEAIDDSYMGEFMELIASGHAQLENRMRAERTVAGMSEAANRGRWPFSPPIGFNKPNSGSEPSLISDPDRGPLIKEAFRIFSSGTHTKKQVRDRVNALGLTTKKGNSVSSQTLDRILRNPIYAGWVVIPKWGLRERGDWEPIVDQVTFDRVQAILDGRKNPLTPYQRNNPDFPLRKFVRCAHCGTPLTGSRSSGRSQSYPYYHCRGKGCQKVRVRKELLEAAFLQVVRELKPKPGLLALFRAIVADVWRSRYDEKKKHRKELDKRLQGLEKQKSQLIQAHIYDQVIGREDFQKEQELLNEKITLARLEIHEATVEEYDVEAVLAFAERVLSDGEGLWIAADLDQRQRYQQMIFPKGLAFDGEKFRTAPTSSMYTYLRQIGAAKDDLASPTGIEPVLPP